MRTVEIDREGECHFRVTWMQGIQPAKSRLFDSRDAAESFAIAKMGARGCVISTLDMTTEQLAAHQARKQRAAALLNTIRGDDRLETDPC
jgi:hypothetical protein